MKFKKFTIKGYRAIKKTEILINHNLRPIIGVNESGKTTILQAILAFDKTSDKYNKGTHLLYANRYESGGNKEAIITADIIIEDEKELEKISDSLELTMGDPLMKELKKKFKNKEVIQLSRNFKNNRKTYSIDNVEVGNKTLNSKLANELYQMLPYILYFDDFSDRVPSQIKFNLNREEETYNFDTTKGSGEWHKLIEEMFKRKKYSLEEYIKKDGERDGENDKEGMKSDVEDLLNNDIIKDWKELITKYGRNIGEESADLKLKLGVKETDSSLIFEFKLKDRTCENAARFFNITERSKGFQWFFNFITKLKYNHKYIKNKNGAIYLLDEPGSYLHTSAQEELLKRLFDISKDNTILYCTHSQFLLDTKVINVGNIILAQKEDGEIKAIPLKESALSEDNGAFAPLYQALRLQLPYLKNNVRHQIITEGIVEYYFLNLIQEYTNKIDKSIVFVPGAGANQLSSLISYAIAFSDNYKVLLDSDKQSRDAYDKYKDQFGDKEIKNFFKYILPTKKEDVQFEEYISEKDINKITNVTGAKNIKGAISILYYLSNADKSAIIKNLSDETLNNMDILFNVVNSVKNKSKQKTVKNNN